MIIASRYDVIKELGHGFWANIFHVKDIRTKKNYALKLFQKLNPDELYEKFSPEKMHHITKIIHKNLIHIKDFGSYQNHIYYLSEYYNGSTLANFRYTKATQELLFDIIVQVCYALNALHSQKVIHENLKPANIIFRIKKNKPEVKVTDYGFLKLDTNFQNDNNEQILPYTAPEIYRNIGAIPQSDFYSLGVILYKITTGILPYTSQMLSNMISGEKKVLTPKLPKELNPNVSPSLENFILKLMEINPSDRFQNIEAIIKHINGIQLKHYHFLSRWSIENNIIFSDYLVRENYSHQLFDFMPIIETGNGKTVSIIAGKGLGKNNCLTLFRYHILGDKYNIFDYQCTSEHRDPFFALIKEFQNLVKNDEKLLSDLQKISGKLEKFLYQSEEVADQIKENDEELSLDFTSTSNFIFHLSDQKPLIFILRAAEYLTLDTIKFINFISKEVTKRKIMIILSSNNPVVLEKIIHPVRIKIESLNFEKTKEYATKLLCQTPPDGFLQKLWKRSYGNPLFLEMILIDLIKKKKIYDIKTKNLDFNYNLDNYIFPPTIQKFIIEQMKHITKKNYKLIRMLASIKTPISKKLIHSVIKISDKELFFMLKEGFDNELLTKRGKYYYFTYQEAQEQFIKETTTEEIEEVSRKIKDFFCDKTFTGVDILKKVIEHIVLLKDYDSIREFKMKLVKLYSDLGKFENSFQVLCEVIMLYFEKKVQISEKDLRQDLQLLLYYSYWINTNSIPVTFKKNVMKLPEISEKYLLIGTFYMIIEKIDLARKKFEQAYELAFSGKQRAEILIYLGRIYYTNKNIKKLESCVKELKQYRLSDELEVVKTEIIALYLNLKDEAPEAIAVIETFLPTIRSQNHAGFFIKMGSLYNVLGFLYHRQRSLPEAEKYFHTARKLWEKVNFKRKLVTSYNNIGDLSLIQGYANKALESFRVAIKICAQIDCLTGSALTLLNHAQAYIKLGEFDTANMFLEQAQKKSEKISSKPFMDSIIDNIAICKIRIINFAYYINFIENTVPDLIREKVYKITPLTKTYFYFLYNLGDYQKIEKILKISESVFFDDHEYEFYYQMLGFLHFQKKDFENSLKFIEIAFEYSKENSSIYAQSINCIRFIESYLGLKKIEKAKEMYKKAEKINSNYNFKYWKIVLEIRRIQIDILDPKINLRIVIRSLLTILKVVQTERLFILEIEIIGFLIQIYASLHRKRKAQEYFSIYKEKIDFATEGLNGHDRQIFYNKTSYLSNDFYDLKTISITSRENIEIDKWQEELYNIIKVKDNNRIKFFMEKAINKLFSPDFFCIIFTTELREKENPFIKYNYDYDEFYSKSIQKNIKLCLERNKVMSRKINSKHVIFVPLKIQAINVGFLILGDDGELSFTRSEISIVKILRFHLTSILIRIKEFQKLNTEKEMMTKLIGISQKFFTAWGLDKLEQEIVLFTMEFIGASRGFLIKKDEYQGYLYKVALDETKNSVINYAHVSKNILNEIQKTREPVFIRNAKSADLFSGFKGYDFSTLSIYSVPIIIDNKVYGCLYFDNYQFNEQKLQINKKFMSLLMIQISLAIKNTMQYENIRAKSVELSTLNNLKNDFTLIVSHELNTPLQKLKSSVRNLKSISLHSKDKKIVDNISTGIEKLGSSITDIVNYNFYKTSKNLLKSETSIEEVIQEVFDHIKNISSQRSLKFKMDLTPNLGKVMLNRVAFKILLEKILLNAVRFTKNEEEITLGARFSVFSQEEINNKESLVIFVQDKGMGIPEHQLEKIFQPFFELGDIYAHSSGLVEYRSSGLGMGLPIAKLIVDLHHGKIWIDSEEDKGTTVHISLPKNEIL
ncbi:MAG: protein kinase [Candidatus Cloacimonetes bacterium]|nr:protein kinase [Candidatus Cloacimonadota bacterium]